MSPRDFIDHSGPQPPLDSLSAIVRHVTADDAQIESVATCVKRRALFARLRSATHVAVQQEIQQHHCSKTAM
jgi:hypothetical protein